MFGFFRKKKPPPVEKSPLEAYDAVLESMERQGRELRKSAATLLGLRSTLLRDEARYREEDAELNRRIEAARSLDAKTEETLRADLEGVRRKLFETQAAHAKVDADVALLTEAAQEHAKQLAELQLERQRAQVRFSAGVVVNEALRAQVAQIDRVLLLDRARDEVERAHALADIYREDQAGKKG